MTAYAAGVLNRIAALTSTRRARDQETQRVEWNGGTTADLQQRVCAVVERLEAAADELEKAIR